MKLLNPITLSLVVVAAFTLCGCNTVTAKSDKSNTERTTSPGQTPNPPSQTASDPAIDTVRNGMLADYNSTTVGKAFEGTFQNPNWTSFVTRKGQTVVQLQGTVDGHALINSGFIPSAAFPGSYSGQAERQCSVALSDEERKTLVEKHARDQDADEKEKEQIHAINLSHSKCVADAREKLVSAIPVTFQFTVSLDNKTFRLTYIDNQIFIRLPPGMNDGSVPASSENVLAFIYR